MIIIKICGGGNIMNKVALITGSARRIGAEIASFLHAKGMNVIIHYRHSHGEAKNLCENLNLLRENSAITVRQDLNEIGAINKFIEKSVERWGRLDALINNASSFYETKIGDTAEDQWEDLFSSNLKAPFFLSQAAAPFLKLHKGTLINIADIHGQNPLKNHTVYSMAKAGLIMLTKSLARELGPEIRVNAVCPGSILWPEDENALPTRKKSEIIDKTKLKRQGSPIEIAKAVYFLLEEATFTTGETLKVDGGR